MTTDPTAPAAETEQSWTAYWRGSGDAGAWTAGGARHPSLRRFWLDFFGRIAREHDRPRLLDLASGNGAVVEVAREVLPAGAAEITCVDISAAAIGNIQRRFAEVRGVVCDAGATALPDGAFDAVSSQFGVEYAGPQAVAEAARLVAPGGRVALVLHCRGGVIDEECAASLDAATTVLGSGFIGLARDLFRRGFEALRGADRAPYDEAATRLAPAARALEQVLAKHGEQVAGGTVASLYADVARIHGRLPNYDPDEVLAWLARMESELEAYAGRMSGMQRAALDDAGFQAACDALRQRGCRIDEAGPFSVPEQERALAWAVLAQREAEEIGK